MTEQGLPGFEAVEHAAMLAHAGTPPALLDRLVMIPEARPPAE